MICYLSQLIEAAGDEGWAGPGIFSQNCNSNELHILLDLFSIWNNKLITSRWEMEIITQLGLSVATFNFNTQDKNKAQ